MTNERTAFLFPGQGAQVVGMGADAHARSPAARAAFAEADDALGVALSRIILEGPLDELTQSHNAQPAILTVSIAYLRAMRERLGGQAPRPSFLAGHSLGEYTALVAADAIDFATGVRLVRRRGELMQAAATATPSGMAALLGMKLDAARAVCAETGAQVANVNSEEQIVIAGPIETLHKAIALAKERGARRAIPLEVAGAFHTEVMRPAQVAMNAELERIDFRAPVAPIIANSTAQPIATPEAIRQELTSQLCGAVLWQQSMERMGASGVTRFIEIGPGKVLGGLAKRIVPAATAISIGELDGLAALT